MKMIVPIDVTDSMLVSSNVLETVATWSSGTTYAADEYAGVPAGSLNQINIYQSLQASNTNNAPASSPAWWNLVNSTYGAWSNAQTYAKGDRVISVSTNSHLVYESIAAGANTNHAVTDTTWWILVGATNRWSMFDQSTTTQTTRATPISVSVKPGMNFNCAAILNVAGTSLRLKMTDPAAGVVYDNTFSLVSNSGIDNWYDYFFMGLEYVDQIIIDDLTVYPNATVDLTVNGAASASVGVFLLGYGRYIGDEQYGAKVGILDYSYKSADSFGNYQIVERPFSKTAQFTAFVQAEFVDQLQIMLAKYRATPVLYVGSPLYGSTSVYGFYQNASVSIDYWNYSVLTIDIEGLT